MPCDPCRTVHKVCTMNRLATKKIPMRNPIGGHIMSDFSEEEHASHYVLAPMNHPFDTEHSDRSVSSHGQPTLLPPPHPQPPEPTKQPIIPMNIDPSLTAPTQWASAVGPRQGSKDEVLGYGFGDRMPEWTWLFDSHLLNHAVPSKSSAPFQVPLVYSHPRPNGTGMDDVVPPIEPLATLAQAASNLNSNGYITNPGLQNAVQSDSRSDGHDLWLTLHDSLEKQRHQPNPDLPSNDAIIRAIENGDIGALPARISSDGWKNIGSAIFLQIFPTSDFQSESLVKYDPNTLVQKFTNNYFERFHPVWPVIHWPTFRLAEEFPVTILSIITIGAALEGNNSAAANWSVVLHEHIRKYLLEVTLTMRSSGPRALSMYLSLLLNLIYSLYMGQAQAMFTTQITMGTVISMARRIGAFDMEYIYSVDDHSESALGVWVRREQKKRLAFIIIRLEAILNALFNVPHTVWLEELSIPLPSSYLLWNAPEVSDWQRLKLQEKKGKQNIYLSQMAESVFKDDTELPALLESDYQVLLSSMQITISRLFLRRHMLLKRTTKQPDAPISSAEESATMEYLVNGLQRWMHDVQPQEAHSNDSTTKLHERSALLNSYIMWHLNFIRFHSDLELFQDFAGRKKTSASEFDERPNLVSQWKNTKFARIALWHAGQIWKIASRRDGSMDVLSIIACFHACLVAWCYGNATESCFVCTQQQQGAPLFELTSDMDITIQDTFINRGGSATFSDFAVCRCAVRGVVSLFLEVMQREAQTWGLAERFAALMRGLEDVEVKV